MVYKLYVLANCSTPIEKEKDIGLYIALCNTKKYDTNYNLYY